MRTNETGDREVAQRSGVPHGGASPCRRVVKHAGIARAALGLGAGLRSVLGARDSGASTSGGSPDAVTDYVNTQTLLRAAGTPAAGL